MRIKMTLVSTILLLFALAGCSSSHSEELVDYYNSYVQTVNAAGEEIDRQTEKLIMIEDDHEALKFHTNNIVPLVMEVEEFITSIEPTSEVVQELHNLRVEQLDAWLKAFELRTEAFKEADRKGSEDSIEQLVQLSDQKFAEAEAHAIEADQRFLQMANEHNVQLVEE